MSESANIHGRVTPDSIAHYRISSKLGEGAMGEVYRAIDSKLGREVAIKLIPEDFAKDSTRMPRFTREAQVLAVLTEDAVGLSHNASSANRSNPSYPLFVSRDAKPPGDCRRQAAGDHRGAEVGREAASAAAGVRSALLT